MHMKVRDSWINGVRQLPRMSLGIPTHIRGIIERLAWKSSNDTDSLLHVPSGPQYLLHRTYEREMGPLENNKIEGC